jgi:hypothetical protein
VSAEDLAAMGEDQTTLKQPIINQEREFGGGQEIINFPKRDIFKRKSVDFLHFPHPTKSIIQPSKTAIITASLSPTTILQKYSQSNCITFAEFE